MRVLSLFDGISCGRVALERAGIPVETYYASEIDKWAMSVALKNYPDIIQIGDVTKVDFKKYRGKIDLLIGGSPCQGFSVAGKQLNFADPRSRLFFEFVRALKEVQPKYFLLENVRMKPEWVRIISEQLGVQPVEINSALVSAQNRKRLYWTNIPGVCQPEDKGIMLKDIVHEYACVDKDKAYALTANYQKLTPTDYLEKHRGQVAFEWLKKYIVPFDKTLRILEKEVEKGKIGYFRQDSQANRVYCIHGKAVCLCGDAGGGAAKMGQYLFGVVKREHGFRNGGIEDADKMPTLTSCGSERNNHLLFGCITPDRVEKRQNGQRFNDGHKFYTLTAQDQHGVLVEGYIRKLTPIECERLQTLPDNYTEGVSNSARYKMLGNGWTVDVIAHIFKGLK